MRFPPPQVIDEAEVAAKAARQPAYDAFARRDAAAPKSVDVPGVLASLAVGAQWRDQLEILKSTDAAKLPTDDATFAVTHASFDLAKAASHLDAAYALETPESVRHHRLFEAMRLGDAFAPGALARELGWDLPAPMNAKLEKLHQARFARDVAARQPRALLAQAIFAPPETPERDALLAAAITAGSSLASRLQLNSRIGREMARVNDQPPSFNLAPALIAEFDAAVTAAGNTPDAFAEWSVVQSLLSPNESQQAASRAFHYLAYWELDRQERLADNAFSAAVQPQIDAVLATLAEWPGINQDDPLRKEWAIAATKDREAALAALETNDGLTALQLFLTATGRGDRGALQLLSLHIREGTGGLPRSTELADRLQAAALKMSMADAEVGDAFAANFIGEAYLNGSNGVTADPIQAFAWLRYAAEMGWTPSARTLAQADAEGLTRTPAELVHWAAVSDACEYNEYLPKPPRRITAPRMDLTGIRPQLDAALTALNSFRTKKPVELTSEQEDAQMLRTDVAKAELKKNPANGLVLLAQIAATDNRYIAHDIAAILGRGDYGVQPDADLAQRFHSAGIALLERDAEYGDFNAAHRLATYALGRGDEAGIATGLRWLVYSAELGSMMAAETLARFYEEGAPGIPADAKKAARWTAFAESTESDNFKPRAPLREPPGP